jgi:hypothetical protein
VRVSIASPLMQPSPNGRRVGIRIVTFEACSSFRSSLFGYCIGERLLTTIGEPIEKHQIHFGSASNDVTLFD